ncbi:DUF4342 domain-containing protein [Tissierella sp. MSJ-40]|uniref:DUF4342 domain-containing protein n=1 Tax=Tissierella simiarum TaxID=2841534 RepID=A0ABS6E750_9FIRM|nr:DUF4342 domain-containing protein [Tissierella simiarum]MBU5438250.1 DUF4342 domain-containing protein [Tissierella simiarum]
MDITLEKIDAIVARTSVSFKEAKEALEEANGDIVEAIIILENKNNKSFGENFTNKGEILVERIKEIVKKGNVTKITIKKDGDVIMNIPVTAAAIGTLISAPLTLIGMSTALLSKCSLEIQKENGEIIEINDLIEKNVEKFKEGMKREKNEDFVDNTHNETHKDDDGE